MGEMCCFEKRWGSTWDMEISPLCLFMVCHPWSPTLRPFWLISSEEIHLHTNSISDNYRNWIVCREGMEIPVVRVDVFGFKELTGQFIIHWAISPQSSLTRDVCGNPLTIGRNSIHSPSNRLDMCSIYVNSRSNIGHDRVSI